MSARRRRRRGLITLVGCGREFVHRVEVSRRRRRALRRVVVGEASGERGVLAEDAVEMLHAVGEQRLVLLVDGLRRFLIRQGLIGEDRGDGECCHDYHLSEREHK